MNYTPAHCKVCNALVVPDPDPKSTGYGLPISKYWKSIYSSNWRIRTEFISEVYCGAECSLKAYEDRGRN